MDLRGGGEAGSDPAETRATARAPDQESPPGGGDMPPPNAVLLDALGTLVVVTDPQGRIVRVNQAFETATGHAGAALRGRHAWEALAPPDEADALQQHYARLRETRAAANREGHCIASDGRWLWVVWTDSPLLDASGAVTWLLSTGVDCTRHRKALEWQGFLGRVSAALAAAPNLEDALARLAELAVPRLADWAVAYLLDQEDARIRRAAIAHREGALEHGIVARLPAEAPRLERLTGIVSRLRAGESVLLEEVTDELRQALATSDEHLELLRRAEVRSVVVVPLCARGQLLGALALAVARSGRRFDADDRAHATELAQQASLAVDNVRLYQETHAAMRRYEESLAQLDLALDSAPVGFAFFDCDLRFVRVNEYLSRHNGVPVEAHVGRTLRDVSPTVADQVEPILHQVLASGEPLLGTENSAEWPPGSGEMHYWIVDGYPVRSREGTLRGVGVVVSEVTERRRMEDALRQRNAELDAIFHALPDLYFRLAADGTYLDVRAGRPSDLYAPSEQLIGRRVTDALPGAAGERVEAAIRQALQTQTVLTVEYPLQIEGEERLFEGRISPLTADQVVVVARNITERKRLEEALRLLSEAGKVLGNGLDVAQMLAGLARLVVPTLGDWCWVFLAETEQQMQRIAVHAADAAQAELAQRLERFPLVNLPQVLRELGTSGKVRRVVHRPITDELLRVLASGEEHLEALRQTGVREGIAAPFRARGRLLGLLLLASTQPGWHYDRQRIGLVEELARRAAVGLDNARLYAEACAANAAKDQFLAVLSHELRNPLAPILAGVEILRRAAPDDPRVQRTVTVIDRNVKLQARLVSDLLDLSRVRSGKITLQRAPVALDVVVEAAVQTLQPDAREAGLTLNVSTEPGLWVNGDADRLQQVVMNLLANAIKFTPVGGRIRVGAWACGKDGRCLPPGDGLPGPDQAKRAPATGRRACLVVEDSGIGISPELLPKLFAMFRQGQIGGQRAAGLGIGLALVKSITEMHGGQVWAESEGPGKGSRFTVVLPLIEPPESGRHPAANEPRR